MALEKGTPVSWANCIQATGGFFRRYAPRNHDACQESPATPVSPADTVCDNPPGGRMSQTSVNGISLVVETNDQAAEIASFLRTLGLVVAGEDGYFEIEGAGLSLTVMRGALVPTPPLGGVLLQLTLDDRPSVDGAAQAAADSGWRIEFGPEVTDFGNYSAFISGPAGITVELSTPVAQ